MMQMSGNTWQMSDTQRPATQTRGLTLFFFIVFSETPDSVPVGRRNEEDEFCL